MTPGEKLAVLIDTAFALEDDGAEQILAELMEKQYIPHSDSLVGVLEIGHSDFGVLKGKEKNAYLRVGFLYQAFGSKDDIPAKGWMTLTVNENNCLCIHEIDMFVLDNIGPRGQ